MRGRGCPNIHFREEHFGCCAELDVREARLQAEKSYMTVVLVEAKDNEILS